MKRNLFLLTTSLILTALFTSCDPPAPEGTDYMAIITFPPIQHEMDIHNSLLVAYDDLSVDFEVSHIMPAEQGKRYIDTVILENVVESEAMYIDFGVQQGYIVGPVFNEFEARIFRDGEPIDTVYYTGPDSDFDLYIFP